MRFKKLDLVLIILAAGLFVWGIVRAIDRGEPAVSSWTTYVMLGTIILATANSFTRSGQIATVILVISVFFIAVVFAAAILGPTEGESFDIASVIRAITFFVLLGIASWLQRPSKSQRIEPISSDQSGTSNGANGGDESQG